MLKDTTLGWYEPSFFKLHIATDETLDNLDALSYQSKSVFIHEYVHYLQDITTSFGLINICNIVNIQKAINSHIRQQPVSFDIPLIWEDTHPEVEQISLSFDAYWGGQGDSKYDSFSFIEGFCVRDSFVEGFETEIPYLVVKYIRCGKKEECVFGAFELMESMAHSIENMLFEKVSAPEYPYKFVRNIVQHIYPEYADDVVFQVIMSDIALNTYHPGKFFYEMLSRLAKDKFRYVSYRDLYDYANDYKFNDKNGKKFTFYSLFEKSAKDAAESFADYYTIPNFDDVRTWGNRVIANAIKLKRDDPYYWISILEKPTKLERVTAFSKTFLPIFGTPLLANNLDDYLFFQTDLFQGDIDNLSSLLGIKEIQEYVRGKKNSCSLQGFCNKTNPAMSMMNCKYPWKVFEGKDSSKVVLCPFTMMLKAWEIYDKKPNFI